MKFPWLGAAVSATLLMNGLAQAQTALPAGDLVKAPRMGAWGFDLAGRDLTVSPREDFYLYANGTYVKGLAIPADRASFGSFDKLNELSQGRMRAVVEKAAADRAATGETAQVGTLYRSFMDEGTVDALGARPLAADLARIQAEKTRADVAWRMGRSMMVFGGSLFGVEISEDAKDPDHYVVYLGQAGLGLPDRDYYLVAGFARQKAAYETYIAQALTLAGWPDPAGAAMAIVAMETEIARVSWTRAARRDDVAMYNPVSQPGMGAMAPGFDWAAFMDGAGLSKVSRVVVRERTAIPKIASIYARTPITTLKAWQAFHLVDQAAPYLAKPFVDAHFHFHGEALTGATEIRPRWKRGVRLVDGSLGEALGKVYVEAYFPPENKAKMLSLVEDIHNAMKGRIERLDWMSPETKARAQEKLGLFRVKIGYPDKWRDYSGLKITDGDLYGNVQRASTFDWNYHVRRLGKPVDKDEWDLTPPTINAYYNPAGNEIVFPAAILQPPFFDPDGDMAINYGGIGAVIGHEMTHGFDDRGRRFDGHGKLTDWWTPQDSARFGAEAAKLGRQFAAFEVLPGGNINSELTMGENIADLGGLLLALDAYHASLHGRPAPVVDGLTGDQRVFLGWAQVWRSKTRDDAMRQRLVSDPHSPERARVDVTVRNVDGFYAAYGVQPGDPMYVAPDDRAHIW